MRQTANAFALSRKVVSKIVSEVSTAITKYLGPVYIKPPFTQAEVTKLVAEFEKFHSALGQLMAPISKSNNRQETQLNS